MDNDNKEQSTPEISDAQKRYLPTGFWGKVRQAGAVDYVDPALGIMGWAVALDNPSEKLTVIAKSKDTTLATSYAILPRPDIDAVLDRETNCSFILRWARFDRLKLEELLRNGDEAIDFYVEEAAGYLVNVCASLKLSTVLKNMDRTYPIHGNKILSELIAYEQKEDESVILKKLAKSGYSDDGQLEESSILGNINKSDHNGDVSDLNENNDLENNSIVSDNIEVIISRIEQDAFVFGWAIDKTDRNASLKVIASFGGNIVAHFYTMPIAENYKKNDLEYGCSNFAFLWSKEVLDNVRALVVENQNFLSECLTLQCGNFKIAITNITVHNIIENSELIVKQDIDPHSYVFQKISNSNLFDFEWYLNNYYDIKTADINPLYHYVVAGESEGRKPNFYYDQEYLSSVSEIEFGIKIHTMLEYIEERKFHTLPTSIHFDAKWYMEINELQENHIPLSYYLNNRTTTSPNEYFDIEFYLNKYPDIASLADPYEHYALWGALEGRTPSENFHTRFYKQTYMSNIPEENPFIHFLSVGRPKGHFCKPTGLHVTSASQVKSFSDVSQFFEAEQVVLEKDVVSDVKTFAFYLAQFHSIPENDLFWGKGFTEWRNVARGQPRFEGHYQPRVPRDLGFYNLLNREAIREQVSAAVMSGLTGFCYYFYWFNGRRVLERPLDLFVNDPTLQMPFCLLWANENWTRRWDGLENDVLLRQDYDPLQDDELAKCFSEYMSSKRYYRIKGRPLLIIYRPGIIPDAKDFFKRLRSKIFNLMQVEPLIFQTQAFGDNDPTVYGLDGAIEFPPHKLANHCQDISKQQKLLDWNFSGQVFDYKEFMRVSYNQTPTDFPLIKTIVPMWDNDARKQGSGLCLINSTPKDFGDWYDAVSSYARKNTVEGESLVFINAWNEWCEGTYLEPDVHYGWAYLNELARRTEASYLEQVATSKYSVMLVGHDAFPSGAQLLLLNIAKQLKYGFGIDVIVVLLSGGDLVDAYKDIGELVVIDDKNDRDIFSSIRKRGFSRAIVNTSAAGRVVETLKSLDFEFLTLIHELPDLIKSYGLEAYCQKISDFSDKLVFASAFVSEKFKTIAKVDEHKIIIRPQGLYTTLDANENGDVIRKELGIPDDTVLILGVGYGDLRKGVDIFSAFARLCRESGEKVSFVWVGALDPVVDRWIKNDINRDEKCSIQFVGRKNDINSYLAAADVVFVPSREDPYPTVVLEALASGLGVIGFQGSGGFNEILANPINGRNIPFGDFSAFLTSVAELTGKQNKNTEFGKLRKSYVTESYSWKKYCFNLLEMLDPGLKKISVVVPNFNYSNYIDQRLQSIFSQSAPIYEVIILDDASSDDSLIKIAEIQKQSKRQIQLLVNKKNSGNVFKQWKKACDVSEGDFIWIAEADDSSSSSFVSSLLLEMNGHNDVVFAFTDSSAIDVGGNIIYSSYKGYYSAGGDNGLDASRNFSSSEFLSRFLAVRNCVLNVSSVIWNRKSLSASISRLGQKLYSFTCAGDWRIYVESCLENGTIVYVDKSHNFHRRHDKSVTGSLAKEKHLNEIKQVQEQVRLSGLVDQNTIDSMESYVRELAVTWEI